MIGYYAHSHGSGHCNYASIFAKVFGNRLTVFTDRDHRFEAGTNVVRLENENPDGSEYRRDRFPEPRALHYAPVNMGKITDRNHRILERVIADGIRLLIIDVSVEIAMLSRVSSIPYAYVRLQGSRTDTAHLNAFEGAVFLLAYFPKEMEPAETPEWIREKTIYLGFLSKFMFERPRGCDPYPWRSKGKSVLLHLRGFGGTRAVDFTGLSNRYDIFSIGPGHVSDLRFPGIERVGIVGDTAPYIQHADAIVAACGSNTVSEILSLGKRFVAVPERRHYKEQRHMAANLERLGWAMVHSANRNLGESLTALAKLRTPLPSISVSGLKAFKSQLEFLQYRSDLLIDQYLHNRRTTDSRISRDSHAGANPLGYGTL